MKKIINILILITLSACSLTNKTSKRSISSVSPNKIDLIETALKIQEDIKSSTINASNCLGILENLRFTYMQGSPTHLDFSQLKTDGAIVLDEMFKARMSLHSLLDKLPKECKVTIKGLFLSMRMVEDMVGVVYYQDKQVSSNSIDFNSVPAPIYEPTFYHPYHLGDGIEKGEKFKFRNGDIMITKGVSFVSSTISELATPKSLYSHIVFVHVDDQTQKIETIESYIGKGVSLYSIEEALKNENARILILRSKDAKVASDAANYMYKKVMDLKNQNKVIPYDFDLDFSDNSKLSCEEVAYDAFKTASEGRFIIPDTMSEIRLNDENFLDRLGLKKGDMMVPADMETDPRFDIVLDWTDFKLMRDSARKDAVLSQVFKWNEDQKYKIRENFDSVMAKVIWSTRDIPGVWPMVSKLAKLANFPVNFTHDVPTKTISTMASLKKLGQVLFDEVSMRDDAYFSQYGYYMGQVELYHVLDDFARTHPKSLESVYRIKY